MWVDGRHWWLGLTDEDINGQWMWLDTNSTPEYTGQFHVTVILFHKINCRIHGRLPDQRGPHTAIMKELRLYTNRCFFTLNVTITQHLKPFASKTYI